MSKPSVFPCQRMHTLHNTHEWTKHSCIEYFWMLPLSKETSSIRHVLSVEGSLRACFCSVPFFFFPTVESVRDARAPPHVPARSAAGGDRSAPPSAPAPRPDRRGPVARFEYKMLVLPTTTEKLSPFLFFLCTKVRGIITLLHIFGRAAEAVLVTCEKSAGRSQRGAHFLISYPATISGGTCIVA